MKAIWIAVTAITLVALAACAGATPSATVSSSPSISDVIPSVAYRAPQRNEPLELEKSVPLNESVEVGPNRRGVLAPLYKDGLTNATWGTRNCGASSTKIFGKSSLCLINSYGTFRDGDVNREFVLYFVPKGEVTMENMVAYIKLGPSGNKSRWEASIKQHLRVGEAIVTPVICPVEDVSFELGLPALHTCIYPITFLGSLGTTPTSHFFDEYVVLLPNNVIMGITWTSIGAESRLLEEVKATIVILTEQLKNQLVTN